MFCVYNGLFTSNILVYVQITMLVSSSLQQKHVELHASQVRQKAQYPSHPLHSYTHNTSQRLNKSTAFYYSRYTTIIPTDPRTVTTADIKTNMRDIHTSIFSQHVAARGNNKI